METLIRLLSEERSDLGLHCLHMPFYQKLSVRIFRVFTVCCFVMVLNNNES